MLYDFHHKQNAKKTGSVHATYLLSGLRRQATSTQTNGVHRDDGEDVNMQSSPFPSSSFPGPASQEEEEVQLTKLMMLAKEEDLTEAKSQFTELLSIHIYSLEPAPIKVRDSVRAGLSWNILTYPGSSSDHRLQPESRCRVC